MPNTKDEQRKWKANRKRERNWFFRKID